MLKDFVRCLKILTIVEVIFYDVLKPQGHLSRGIPIIACFAVAWRYNTNWV